MHSLHSFRNVRNKTIVYKGTFHLLENMKTGKSLIVFISGVQTGIQDVAYSTPYSLVIMN